ncbi:MAG: ATP-binding protein [Chloroflexota bacterium]
MEPFAAKFADLLTTAVRTIAARTNKTIASVQDELGYALGRAGGSSIEYWRKGHIPADLADLEKLAGELVRRQGFTQEDCEQFLRSADHPEPTAGARQFFPAAPPSPPLSRPLSPFVVGLPITTPRQFFGRERELKRIFDLWRHFPLQSIAVMGLKRSGKTSLLHYLKAITQTPPTELRPGQRAGWLPQPERYRWVFVDFQDARLGKQERLLRYLLTSLNMPVPTPCRLDNFMDVFSAHLHHPTVILMDEISAGLAAPELDEAFWGSLRSLVSHYVNGHLAFVLATPAALAQLAQDQGKPSPFFNIFYTLELGPLTDPEARQLIGSSPQPFALAEIEWIVDQSGRWPCLLQILGQTRLAALAEGQAGETWRAEGLRQIEPFRYLLGS